MRMSNIFRFWENNHTIECEPETTNLGAMLIDSDRLTGRLEMPSWLDSDAGVQHLFLAIELVLLGYKSFGCIIEFEPRAN